MLVSVADAIFRLRYEKKTASAKNYLVLTTKNPWLNLVGGG
jgi:hypothetical protein